MKNKSVSLLIAGAICTLPLAATAQVASGILAEWNFTLESDYGKHLTEIPATGSTGAGNFFNNNIGNSSVGEISSDRYAYRILGASSGSTVIAQTGITTRPSSVSLIVESGGWDFSTVTATNQRLLSFEIDHAADGGYPLGAFALYSNADADGINIRFYGPPGAATQNGTVWHNPGINFSLVQSDISFALHYDMESLTATFSYSLNGGSWIDAFTFNQFANYGVAERIPTAVKVITLGSFAVDSYFDLESITVTTSQIPEPSTYALLGGVLALAGTVVARRRTAKRS